MQSKNLKSKLKVSNDTPSSLNIDGEKYKQVLLNLVQNAVKFTQSGGISIIVGFTSEKCQGGKKCGFLGTTVRDSGQGIDEKTKQTLF